MVLSEKGHHYRLINDFPFIQARAKPITQPPRVTGPGKADDQPSITIFSDAGDTGLIDQYSAAAFASTISK